MVTVVIAVVWILCTAAAVWFEVDSYRASFEVTRGHLIVATVSLFLFAPLAVFSMFIVWIIEGRLAHYIPWVNPDWFHKTVYEQHKEER